MGAYLALRGSDEAPVTPCYRLLLPMCKHLSEPYVKGFRCH